MPRRYKLGADGQAHPAYFGKLPRNLQKEDTLRFSQTRISSYTGFCRRTLMPHSGQKATSIKTGHLSPFQKKETVMQEQTGGAPAATQEPMKLDVSVRLIDPVKNLIGFASEIQRLFCGGEFQDTARRKRDLCRYAQPAGQKRGLP